MTDLIRRSDALAACAPIYGWSIAAAEELEEAIAALPAVTVNPAAIREAALMERAVILCQQEADRGHKNGQFGYHLGAVACRNAIQDLIRKGAADDRA